MQCEEGLGPFDGECVYVAAAAGGADDPELVGRVCVGDGALGGDVGEAPVAVVEDYTGGYGEGCWGSGGFGGRVGTGVLKSGACLFFFFWFPMCGLCF